MGAPTVWGRGEAKVAACSLLFTRPMITPLRNSRLSVGPSAAVLGLCIGAMLLSVKVLYSAPSRSDCHGAASSANAERDRAPCWLLAKAGPGFSFSTRGERREGMWVFAAGMTMAQHECCYPCTGSVSSPSPPDASLPGALHSRTASSHVGNFRSLFWSLLRKLAKCRYRDQTSQAGDLCLWPLRSPICVVFVFLVGMAPAVGLRLRSRHSELPNRV